MGYALIPLIVSAILAVQHVVLSGATRASKAAVAGVVLLALLVWHFYPRWLVGATLLQVGVSAYVLVHARLERT